MSYQIFHEFRQSATQSRIDGADFPELFEYVAYGLYSHDIASAIENHIRKHGSITQNELELIDSMHNNPTLKEGHLCQAEQLVEKHRVAVSQETIRRMRYIERESIREEEIKPMEGRIVEKIQESTSPMRGVWAGVGAAIVWALLTVIAHFSQIATPPEKAAIDMLNHRLESSGKLDK